MPIEHNTGKHKTENNLELIAPFIQNTVMLYDTTKLLNGVKYGNSSKDYIAGYGTKFLNYTAFNSLKKRLEETFNDPKSWICSDAEKESSLTLSERKNIMFMKDSKGFSQRINSITFFEEWYYNKQTGEIVKKQLGYAVCQWDYNKEAVREWYLYFTSKDARTIYLKYS